MKFVEPLIEQIANKQGLSAAVAHNLNSRRDFGPLLTALPVFLFAELTSF